MRVVLLLGGAAAAALALTACDGKPSAVATGDRGASAPMYSSAAPSLGGRTSGAPSGGGEARTADPRDAPTPLFEGKPMWAANRNHTAEENAQYQFSKNGGDFGAASETDYLTKVHAFIAAPPRDAQTLDRPNGDKLIYDPKGNIFAVVSRTGAPRTMFKPRDGAAYWDQQKARESQRETSSRAGGSDQS